MVTPGPENAATDPRPLAGEFAAAPWLEQPRQAHVYREYLHLHALADRHFQAQLAGRLVACAGFGRHGAELAFASTIAGAAFLGIEADPRSLKAAVRNGSCNFMVNTLDEALRVLKNEIRKRQPVSVGLLGFAGDLLPAMVERGVQPDMFRDTTSPECAARYKLSPSLQNEEAALGLQLALTAHRQAIHRFAERGTVIVQAASMSPPAHNLQVVWTASSLPDMRRMDSAASEIFPADDLLYRRWLHGSAAAFHRQLPRHRIVDMQPAQLQQMLAALTALHRSAPFTSPASICWQAGDGPSEEISW